MPQAIPQKKKCANLWNVPHPLSLNPSSPPLKDFLAKADKAQKKRVNLLGPLPSKALNALEATSPQVLTSNPTLLIDGGLHHLKTPHPLALSLGDADSSREKLDLTFPPSKDHSDLALGLKVLNLLSPPPFELHLFGFLGGRKDHEWGALLDTASWLKSKTQTFARFEKEWEVFSPGTFALSHQGGFSLFTFEKNTSLLQGAVTYPLASCELTPLGSHGLSNQARGSFTWSCDSVALFCWRG